MEISELIAFVFTSWLLGFGTRTIYNGFKNLMGGGSWD